MIKEGIVCYRFRSEKKSDNVTFPGDTISIGELKELIESKRMRNSKSECFKRKVHYDFNIFDMTTMIGKMS